MSNDHIRRLRDMAITRITVLVEHGDDTAQTIVITKPYKAGFSAKELPPEELSAWSDLSPVVDGPPTAWSLVYHSLEPSQINLHSLDPEKVEYTIPMSPLARRLAFAEMVERASKDPSYRGTQGALLQGIVELAELCYGPGFTGSSEVTGERWEVQSKGRARWHVVKARETEQEAREALEGLRIASPNEELRIRHIRSVAETV